MRAALRLPRLAAPAWLRANWLESALALTLLGGWGLTVWGLGEILGPWLAARGIWAIGAGLLLLGCSGFKLLAALLKHGLYSLSQVREK